MIVRILTDNQYRLPDDQAPDVDRLDSQLLTALNAGDESRFQRALQELVQLVRTHGTLVPNDELVTSDAIVPAPDMTLAETRERLAHAEVHMPTE